MSAADFMDRLEPDAAKLYADSEAKIELAVNVSLAISMKRIGDALWGVEGTAGVLELLNPLQVRNHY